MDTDSLQAILDELTKMRASRCVAIKVPEGLTFTRGPPAMRDTPTRPKARYPEPRAAPLRLAHYTPSTILTMATGHMCVPPYVHKQTEKYAGHTSRDTKTLDYRIGKGISRQIICNQHAPHMVAFSEHLALPVPLSCCVLCPLSSSPLHIKANLAPR
jgi:hypothetical protein